MDISGSSIVYPQKKLAPSCLQSSFDPRTNLYWSRAANGVRRINYGTTTSGCWFFNRNHLYRWGCSFLSERLVDEQNCRIWGSGKLRAIGKAQMHPQPATARCGFRADGIFGLIFVENAANQVEIVNRPPNCYMVIRFLCLNCTIQMWTSFPGRVIARFCDRNLLLRSSNLTSLNLFSSRILWNLRLLPYALRKRIEHLINKLQLHLCKTCKESSTTECQSASETIESIYQMCYSMQTFTLLPNKKFAMVNYRPVCSTKITFQINFATYLGCW